MKGPVLVNLTPHPVILESGEGLLTLPRCPEPARLEDIFREVAQADGVALYSHCYGEPECLPDPEAGKILVVSSVIRQALPHRYDLVSPCLFVRDEAGRIIRAKGLCGSPWLGSWSST